MSPVISAQDVAQHNTPDDLWTVVDGVVYDLTEFAPKHPGGIDILAKYAGRDATAAYNTVHAPSLIRTSLPESKHIGIIDPSTVPASWSESIPGAQGQKTDSQAPSTTSKPPLESLISTHDFRLAASRSFSPKTWAFVSSAATDLHTLRRNASAWSDIGLRPRVLADVSAVSTRARVLGAALSAPIFVAPTSLGRLVHPRGEVEIARACARLGIPQCVSTSASFPLGEIAAALRADPDDHHHHHQRPPRPPPPLYFQLYVDKDRSRSEELLRSAAAQHGVAAVFLTVDAPVPGKREADERLAADETVSSAMAGTTRARNDAKGGALGRVMGSYIDASVSWGDIPWLRGCVGPGVALVLKGVQTAADAVRAVEAGVQGIVVSNHGGRSLDTAPATALVLLELQRCCPEVFDRVEVYVDGGIMRGTDVFKALCLGARAVGIGRGVLYGLNYGEEGIKKYVDILTDELETTMKMCGITSLDQVHPGLLNTLAVDHLVPTSAEHPYAKWRPGLRGKL
ncbi:FMN-dependent dehydrogenase-domain-containing protein [Pleurostoma richardsiae]|uniref:L-lactate dehydrogenase (cytochrome) n=1 Tax=Pleurostoma richardsiae TaxID=41990 RepID=A0AA38VNF0_9PEZI|nr:FMN-dependent dehydrogenase-domain-containing protein [Pleurostoma richardsiae]